MLQKKSEENGHLPPIAQTPEPPYTAVIFTSVRTDGDQGYPRRSVGIATVDRDYSMPSE